MFAVMAKIYRVFYNRSSSITFDETYSYWSAPKAHNFSAFHLSQHGILVSIGQHFVTTRVVHLPKRPEPNLSTESDLITESDQAVRAVHSCNSCLFLLLILSLTTSSRLLTLISWMTDNSIILLNSRLFTYQ